MPTFKDFAQSDISTFFNLDEFAETHNINGVDMPAVVDSDILKERPRQPADLFHASEGIYLDEVVLFVRMSDLGERPVIGQPLRVDGKLYLVSSCTETAGVLEIGLGAHRA